MAFPSSLGERRNNEPSGTQSRFDGSKATASVAPVLVVTTALAATVPALVETPRARAESSAPRLARTSGEVAMRLMVALGGWVGPSLVVRQRNDAATLPWLVAAS